MPIVANNLTGLDITCASVVGYTSFNALMRAAGKTGYLFFRHGFKTPSEVSVYLRGIGLTGAPHFLTASIGEKLTLEFADPADAHKFYVAAGSKQSGPSSPIRLSAPFVVVEPTAPSFPALSDTLKAILLESDKLQKVLPEYNDLEIYIRDLLTHEHAFRDEYMVDFTFEKIAAAISEKTFSNVVEYIRRHSPNRKNPAALALELSTIYGILIEDRECRYAQLGPALDAIAHSLTDADDLADVAELQAIIKDKDA